MAFICGSRRSNQPRKASNPSDSTSTDLEEAIDWWTLRFHDSRREHGFLLVCSNRAASKIVLLHALCAAYVSAILMNIFFRWGTSGGNFVSSSDTASMASTRNLILIVTLLTSIAGMIGAKLHLLLDILGPSGLERFAMMSFTILVFVCCVTQPWYLARLFSFDPRTVVANQTAFDDANVILALDAIVTGVHLLLPSRWYMMIPLDAFVVVCYPVMAFGLGSPMPIQNIIFNSLTSILLVLAACSGKRSNEFHERSEFVRIASERTKRVQVEHQLHRVEERLHKASELASSDVASSAESLPTSAGTESVFQGLDGLGSQETTERLEQIKKMGHAEHWLIPAADVVPKADEILGCGNFGLVMAASWHGATVVLKAPHAAFDAALGKLLGSGLTAAAHELRMLRHIRHPNIVLFFGACIVPETQELVLVLEHVRGMQLGLFMREKPDLISMDVRGKLAADTCSALLYLHSHQPRIVHGDLKDSNTLVEHSAPNIQAKLVDFGLSRILTRKARPLGGTPLHWMAPELLVANPCAPAPSADIFSFGRLLGMIISGQVALSGVKEEESWGPMPFTSEDSKASVKEEPLLMEWRELCETCCRREPSQRPSTQDVYASIMSLSPLSPASKAKAGLRDALADARAKAQVILRGYGSGQSSGLDAMVSSGGRSLASLDGTVVFGDPSLPSTIGAVPPGRTWLPSPGSSREWTRTTVSL